MSRFGKSIPSLIAASMQPGASLLLTCLLILTIGFSPARPVLAADQAEQATLNAFNKMLQAKVETIAILDGEDGAIGGLYTFSNKSSLRIMKFGGRGALGEPKAIGATGLKWVPLLGGNIGYSEARSDFTDVPLLLGNSETYTSYAIGGEAGARIFLTNRFSVAPMLGLIYSHTCSSFTAGTLTGVEMKRLYGGQLVDWSVHTLSFVPSMDLQYQRVFADDWKLTLTTNYAWFQTNDFARSSIYQKVSGNSSFWDNRADLDIRLPWKLFGFPLHAGYFVSFGILGNDLRDGLNSNDIVIQNCRLGIGDLKGRWKLNRVGLGVSYIKASDFSGYSWGLDVSF